MTITPGLMMTIAGIAGMIICIIAFIAGNILYKKKLKRLMTEIESE